MSTNLRMLAEACYVGACNPHGIIRSLGEYIDEIPTGRCRESVELKIIIGQLSFLLGESLGPTTESIEEFRRIDQSEK